MTSAQLQLAITDYLRTHSVHKLLEVTNAEIQRQSSILEACSNEECKFNRYTIEWREPELLCKSVER